MNPVSLFKPQVLLRQARNFKLQPLLHDTERMGLIAGKFSFWAPVGNAVFGPLLLNREYKQKGRPDSERKMLVFQELASQSVNLAMHWTSFLVLKRVVKAVLLKKYGIAPEIALAFAGSVGSFLGMSFLRPIVSAKLLNKWMPQEGDAKAKSAPGAPAAAQPFAGTPPIPGMTAGQTRAALAPSSIQRSMAPPSLGYSPRAAVPGQALPMNAPQGNPFTAA